MPAMSGPEIRSYIVAGVLPFNVIKGIVMSLCIHASVLKNGNLDSKTTDFFKISH